MLISIDLDFGFDNSSQNNRPRIRSTLPQPESFLLNSKAIIIHEAYNSRSIGVADKRILQQQATQVTLRQLAASAALRHIKAAKYLE